MRLDTHLKDFLVAECYMSTKYVHWCLSWRFKKMPPTLLETSWRFKKMPLTLLETCIPKSFLLSGYRHLKIITVPVKWRQNLKHPAYLILNVCNGRCLHLFHIQLCDLKFAVKDLIKKKNKNVLLMLLGHESSVYRIVQKAIWSAESWEYVHNAKFLKKPIQGKGNK